MVIDVHRGKFRGAGGRNLSIPFLVNIFYFKNKKTYLPRPHPGNSKIKYRNKYQKKNSKKNSKKNIKILKNYLINILISKPVYVYFAFSCCNNSVFLMVSCLFALCLIWYSC
jgi:hypothetical protein